MDTNLLLYSNYMERGLWKDQLYIPNGFTPTHWPPCPPMKGLIWVWLPNEIWDTNPGDDDYNRWALAHFDNGEHDGSNLRIYLMPTYKEGSYSKVCLYVQKKAARAEGSPRQTHAINRPFVLISIIVVALLSIALIGPRIRASAGMPSLPGSNQVSPSQSSAASIDAPNMDNSTDLIDTPALSDECKALPKVPVKIYTGDDGKTHIKYDPDWQDPAKSFVPKPGEKYCVENPQNFYQNFLQDSTIESLEAWDLTNDSVFTNGGSILRRATLMWSSKYRMSIKATQPDKFLLRWNESYYKDVLAWMKKYRDNPADPASYILTFSSSAPEDKVDRDRLLTEDPPLPGPNPPNSGGYGGSGGSGGSGAPATASYTPFQPATFTPTNTATLIPTDTPAPTLPPLTPTAVLTGPKITQYTSISWSDIFNGTGTAAALWKDCGYGTIVFRQASTYNGNIEAACPNFKNPIAHVSNIAGLGEVLNITWGNTGEGGTWIVRGGVASYGNGGGPNYSKTSKLGVAYYSVGYGKVTLSPVQLFVPTLVPPTVGPGVTPTETYVVPQVGCIQLSYSQLKESAVAIADENGDTVMIRRADGYWMGNNNPERCYNITGLPSQVTNMDTGKVGNWNNTWAGAVISLGRLDTQYNALFVWHVSNFLWVGNVDPVQ